MSRFLSPEWADAFNSSLQGTVVPGPGPEAGLGAINGSFTMVQEVYGTPDGDVRLTLRFDDGSLHLDLEVVDLGTAQVAASTGTGTSTSTGDSAPSDVTIVLSYEDAAAMSRGELAPAKALNAGRVRVRGDLSVLVAAQQMLNAAWALTQRMESPTSY